MLLCNKLQGVNATGDDCGCAIGTACPQAAELGRLIDTNSPESLYNYGHRDELQTGLPLKAVEAAKAFYAWVVELGGDGEFLDKVTYWNDDYENWSQSRRTCQARFKYVLGQLRAQSIVFDQEQAG
jgi:hypothetical protein